MASLLAFYKGGLSPPVGDKDVACFALLSRVIVCVMMVLSDLLVPDFVDSDDTVATFEVTAGVRAFARWDAARFLLVARNGYVDEQSFAHFPGLPVLLRACTFSDTSVFAVATGVALTNASFVASAVLFHRYSLTVHDERLSRRALLLYCFSPASVFFSSVYTESPYALFTLTGLIFLSKDQRTLASWAFAVGTCFRSNGIVNAGFLCHDAILRAVKGRSCVPILVAVAGSVLVVLPNILFLMYGYVRFCLETGEDGTRHGRVWCNDRLPNVYTYVQQAHWELGLFSYWQLKQLPNFLLASPAVIVVLVSTATFARSCWAAGLDASFRAHGLLGPMMVPHVVQMCALTLLALLVMRVEVVTRFLCAACPSFHWWLAHFSLNPRWAPWVYIYVISYVMLGILLHANRLPWT